MDIREKIQVGNLIEYKGKKYIVSGLWFQVGGNSMVCDLIKETEQGTFILFVKHIYDEDIENCIIKR